MKNFEYPILLFNYLVDSGAKESIETIKGKVENRQLFDYLADKYEEEELRVFAVRKEVEEYLVDFFNTYDDGDFGRKFLVKNNGLSLIIAALVFS